VPGASTSSNKYPISKKYVLLGLGFSHQPLAINAARIGASASATGLGLGARRGASAPAPAPAPAHSLRNSQFATPQSWGFALIGCGIPTHSPRTPKNTRATRTPLLSRIPSPQQGALLPNSKFQFPGMLVGPLPTARKCHQMPSKEHMQLGWVVRWVLSTPPSHPAAGRPVRPCSASTSLAHFYSLLAPRAPAALRLGIKAPLPLHAPR
jgi:hypothetical protein